MNRIIPGGMEDSDSDDDIVVHRYNTKSQQTCLLRSVSTPTPSKKNQRKKDYFAAKEKDKRMGPIERPQEKEENHDFFKDAVRRNLGLGKQNQLTASVPQITGHTITPPTIMKNVLNREPQWVCTMDDVDVVAKHLKSEVEVSIDFENNTDHSYQGMTALVQLSTVHKDIILDPFPALIGVKAFIVQLMTNVTTLKILCGADNDFLNIRRDFEAIPNNCIDIQFLDKRIRNIPSAHSPRGLKELTLAYLHVNIPKGETNRDWRRRPLPKDMQKYAQADSYYCMAVFQTMKQQLMASGKTGLIFDAVGDTSERIKKILLKEKSPPSVDISRTDIRALLYDWRNTTAKLVDDKPANVLSDQLIEFFIANPPESMEELLTHTEKHKSNLKGNVSGLYRLLKEKTAFYRNTQCRKCSVFGHSAIQCNQPIDRNIEKMLYVDRPELKTKQNQRRRRNKLKNKRLREEEASRK